MAGGFVANCEHNLDNAYREAYALAGEKLSALDSRLVCANTKATFSDAEKTYTVRYFNQLCHIRLGNGEVVFEGETAGLPVTEKVLVLHYLIHATPAPLRGELISFKEIPGGGAIYYGNFKKRAIDPLVNVFSNNLAGFAAAAKAIGGEAETLGDASAVVSVFPLVPVTYVIWQGDEEIPSSGTILFDKSVTGFLPDEDIVVVAGYGVYRMIGHAKKGMGAGR